jgi:hypothetical protein
MSDTEFTETHSGPAPLLLTGPVTAAPVAARRAGWGFLLLGLICVLLRAGGEGYLWYLGQTRDAVQGTQLAVLQAQMADVRAQVTQARPAPDSVVVQADLAQKFAALAAQVNAMQTQLAADHGTLTTLQANSADLTKLTARVALLNQIETARMALDAGQPLGPVADAPPALAQFSATPPPTEAALVIAFPAAARAGAAASVGGAAKTSYWTRVRARLENLVTVSDGTRVVLGAPAAGVLLQARELLDAGDLAGAVARLDTLSVTTQQAMSGWLGQARALLAARAALIAMAGQA